MKRLVFVVLFLLAVPVFPQGTGTGGPGGLQNPVRFKAPLAVYGNTEGFTVYNLGSGDISVQFLPAGSLFNSPTLFNSALFIKVHASGNQLITWPAVSMYPRIQDEGMAQLASDGTAVVTVNPVFGETYLVHLTPYGPESIYVSEVYPDRFVVKAKDFSGNPVSFSWRISALYEPAKGAKELLRNNSEQQY